MSGKAASVRSVVARFRKAGVCVRHGECFWGVSQCSEGYLCAVT